MEVGSVILNKRIWEYDVMDEYELEDFTETTLTMAENRLGVKLPVSYVELMRTQNGGRLFRNSIQLDQLNIRVDHLFGIGEKLDGGILITPYMIKEWGLPNNIVLISGDGHSWVCLDYRNNKENPYVSFIDTEENIDIKLANEFKDFTNILTKDSDENESKLIAENTYTISELKKIVQDGDDPFLITDGFLYFSEVDCDLEWLVSQAIIIMDNPDEFVAPEVMAYMMKKIASVELSENESEALILLANKIKGNESSKVKKYYKKITSYIK